MIVVNARFLTQELSGVQRYAIEISRQLRAIYPAVRFVAPKNILHEDIAKELNVEVVGEWTGHLWEQVSLPWFLINNDRPILLNFGNLAPVFYKNKISTIHDITFERFPKNFNWLFGFIYRIMIPRVLFSSKLILTVSQFSKSEIMSFYGESVPKIEVVYNSVSKYFCSVESAVNEDYILAVSSISNHKNFSALVKAFNLADIPGLKLFVVGARSGNFSDPDVLSEVGNNPNIIFCGRVSDSELRQLYSGALAFFFPSLYEGFGIPPLEAQACACPCVVSDIPSLNEVMSDSALFFNPYDVNDIAEKMYRVISDGDLRCNLREKGFHNLKRFSWNKSAKLIIKAVEDVK